METPTPVRILPGNSLLGDLGVAPGVFGLRVSSRQFDGDLYQSLTAHATRIEHIPIIVANNRFEVTELVVAAQAQGLDPEFALTRIQIARAETIYQVRRCAQRLLASSEALPVVCVLGLLHPFYDEGLKWTEAQRMLEDTLAMLKGLAARQSSVIVTIEPEPLGKRKFLLSQFSQGVNRLIDYAPLPQLTPQFQERLF